MNKKIVKNFILILILSMGLFLTSCSLNDLLKTKTTNEIYNKYIDYTQDITVENIEEALVEASSIAKTCTLGIIVTKTTLFSDTYYLGSGVILARTTNADNSYHYLVVTNRHVIGTATNVTIKVYLGTSYCNAKLLTYDVTNDLALICFDTSVLLNVAKIYDGTLKEGQFAIAVGSPYDLEEFYNTVTVGSISASKRIYKRENANGEMVDNEFIQHDAAINSGNSGGGLYDIYGRLIGINTWKLVGDLDDHIEGINFAIPIRIVYETFSNYLPKTNE